MLLYILQACGLRQTRLLLLYRNVLQLPVPLLLGVPHFPLPPKALVQVAGVLLSL